MTAALARALPLVAGAMIASCTSEPVVAPDQPKTVQGRELGPYDSAEECAHLAAGERLDYGFRASNPVAFNIHYHSGNVVVAPVSREHATEDSGIFVAALAEDYCLMWEAGPGGAQLDYRVALRPAAK